MQSHQEAPHHGLQTRGHDSEQRQYFCTIFLRETSLIESRPTDATLVELKFGACY
jgi:hypothetical protein